MGIATGSAVGVGPKVGVGVGVGPKVGVGVGLGVGVGVVVRVGVGVGVGVGDEVGLVAALDAVALGPWEAFGLREPPPVVFGVGPLLVICACATGRGTSGGAITSSATRRAPRPRASSRT